MYVYTHFNVHQTHSSVLCGLRNEACAHQVSLLTLRTKYAFVSPWSLVRARPNSLCRCRHNQDRTHTKFEINRVSNSWWYNSSKSCSFSFFLHIFLLLFAHLYKTAINTNEFMDTLQIWHVLKGIWCASWHQIWFKYKQNWQSYKRFFHKKWHQYVCCHNYRANKLLKISKWIP